MATNKKTKNKLADKQANEFDFKSKIEGPIAELSHLERSLLMAEISMMSYLNVEQCNIAAGHIGFSQGKFFDRSGSQAYWFQSEYDSVVVFRGTEADDWNALKRTPTRLRLWQKPSVKYTAASKVKSTKSGR